MHLGVGEAAAVRRGDPGIEHLVRRPDGDHDRLTLAFGWFQHELAKDAMRFAHLSSLSDPGQVALALRGWDSHCSQADDHGSPPRVAWPGSVCSECTRS